MVEQSNERIRRLSRRERRAELTDLKKVLCDKASRLDLCVA
jgi:hypothetical protein